MTGTWREEMIRNRLILFLAVLLIPAFCCSQAARPSYQPKDGFVPDAATAIAIAQAVWGPIYGQERIAQEKPFKAVLRKGVWTVEGSLPRGYMGGVALAEIAKQDGRVLRVVHGK